MENVRNNKGTALVGLVPANDDWLFFNDTSRSGAKAICDVIIEANS